MYILFPSGLELPRINYDINGRRHRFVYGNVTDKSVLSKEVTFPFVFITELMGTSVFVISCLNYLPMKGPNSAGYERADILNMGLLGNRLFQAALFCFTKEANCRIENRQLAQQKKCFEVGVIDSLSLLVTIKKKLPVSLKHLDVELKEGTEGNVFA